MSINTGRSGEKRDTKTSRKPVPTPVERVVENTKQRVHNIKNPS